MKMCEASSTPEDLHFRYAIEEDKSLLLQWRNNPKVRQYSQKVEPIRKDDHDLWFSVRLAQIRKEPILIFDFKDKSVGMVRLDKKEKLEKVFEISVLVDESFQNRGFATQMVSRILTFARNELSAIEIRAIIHCDNQFSIAHFRNLKFIKNNNLNLNFDEYRLYL